MDPDLVRQQFDEEADFRRSSNAAASVPLAITAPDGDPGNIVPLIVARAKAAPGGAAQVLSITPVPAEQTAVSPKFKSSLIASSSLSAFAWIVASLASLLGYGALQEGLGYSPALASFIAALAIGAGLTVDPLMKCERLTLGEALTLAGLIGCVGYFVTWAAFGMAAQDTGFPIAGGAYWLNVVLNSGVAVFLTAGVSTGLLYLAARRKGRAGV